MEQIKQEIINNIYENGENLITGPILQEVLLDMVDDYNSKVSSGSVPGDLVEKTGSWDDAADWVEDNSGSLVHDTDLDGYATERWVEDQGYLKEVPEGYATTESLNELSESVAELSSSIPSVDLSGYATTESVNEATESVKDWVEAKHYLTTASLSGSVTEETVGFMINDATASVKEWVNSQSYATETFVSESIANLDIPDTSGFVTTQSYNQDSASFDERINSISGSDLSGYATTESLNQLSESVAEDLEGKADRSDLPDLTGYATEQWVQEQGYLTEHQDISGLATTESVNSLSESVANDFANLNIPDVSGFATTSSVNSLSESVATDILGLSESIAAITGSDLSGYATTSSLNQLSESVAQDFDNLDIPDISSLATTSSVNALSESVAALSESVDGYDIEQIWSAVNALEDAEIITWDDESEEYTAVDVATAEDLALLSESVADDFGNLSNSNAADNPIADFLENAGLATRIPDPEQGVYNYNLTSVTSLSESVAGDITSLSESIAAITGSDLSGYVTTASYNTDSASFDQRIDAIVVPDLSEYATTASLNELSESLGNYLPISGGEITGDLRVDGKFRVGTGSAAADGAAAIGTGVRANKVGELGVGRYNYTSSVGLAGNGQLFSVGVGNETQDRNAISVVRNNTAGSASVYVQGVGGYNGTNPQPGTNDLATVISSITGSDLSGYATTESVNSLSESVATDFANLNIPDISGLATTSSVNSLSASLDQRINSITASGEDAGLRSFLFGNLTQNLNSISGSATNIYSEISADTTLGFDSIPDDGRSIGITVHNLAADESIVTLPDSVAVGGVTYNLINNGTDNSGSVGIPAGEYGDIVVTRKGTDLFLRTSIDLGSISGSAPDLSGYATTASLNELSESLESSSRAWVVGEGNNSAVLPGAGNKARTGSVAHGRGSEAYGTGSHAEGYCAKSVGVWSHAEGEYTEAQGRSSHAEGFYVNTSEPYEHAEGRYNVTHSNQIFSVGVGKNASSRRNAISIITGSNPSASIYLYGIGGYDGTNPTPGVNDAATTIGSLSESVYNINQGLPFANSWKDWGYVSNSLVEFISGNAAIGNNNYDISGNLDLSIGSIPAGYTVCANFHNLSGTTVTIGLPATNVDGKIMVYNCLPGSSSMNIPPYAWAPLVCTAINESTILCSFPQEVI